MKSLSQTSLHTRIVWSLVVVATVALVVCGTLVFILQERSIANKTQASLEEVQNSISQLAAEGIDRRTGKPFATPPTCCTTSSAPTCWDATKRNWGFGGTNWR